VNDEKFLRELGAAARRSEAGEALGALEAPLGEPFHARVAELILAEQTARRSAPITAPVIAPVIAIERARSRRPVAAALAAFVAAAGILLALSHPWKSGDAQDLPEYGLTVTGGQDTSRGASPSASSEVTATAGAPLTVTLRPPSEVSGPVDVHVLGVRGDTVTDARATVRTSPSGAVEVRGTAYDLVGGALGRAELVVVIARGGLDLDLDALARGRAAPHGVKVGRFSLRIVP
jgi:hypothetical protein